MPHQSTWSPVLARLRILVRHRWIRGTADPVGGRGAGHARGPRVGANVVHTQSAERDRGTGACFGGGTCITHLRVLDGQGTENKTRSAAVVC